MDGKIGMKSMKIFKPKYYEKFSCIAAACDFTCCQEWNIAVDDATFLLWQNMQNPSSTLHTSLADTTTGQNNDRSLLLDSKKKCVHLREDGLCRLVLTYGEDSLSKTCHTFPRERHEYADRVEYTLSLGCKTVLDKLWEQDRFTVVSSTEGESVDELSSLTPSLYFQIRDWFLDLAGQNEIPLAMTMQILFYLLLDLFEKESEDGLTQESLEQYKSSEVVELLKESLKEPRGNAEDSFYECNELFLDISENYRLKEIYLRFLSPVIVAAQQYENEDSFETQAEDFAEFFKAWEGFQNKMRVLLCEEIYSSMLLPYSDLSGMVMKFEWIAMELCVIRHWAFLHFQRTRTLTDEDLKQIVAVVFRMMGYNDDDIEEYIQNSFESVLWDWGYLALLVSPKF